MNRKKVRRASVLLLSFGLCLATASPGANYICADAAGITNRLLSGNAAGRLFQFEKSYEEKLAEANKRKEDLERKKQAVGAQFGLIILRNLTYKLCS